MKTANIFLILGLGLYVLAGISAISQTNYSFIVLLASLIFLALGFYASVKFRWIRMFKKD